jgi:hypothetical protein
VAGAAAFAVSVGDAAGKPVYRYIGDQGRPVYTDDPGKIPEARRRKAEIQSGTPGPQIYRYRGPHGRAVYVNDRLRIPAPYRDRAELVDLSHISLGHELAAGEMPIGLGEVIDHEYDAVLATGYCAQARREAGAGGWLRRFWREQGHLGMLGGLLIVLLCISPLALRSVGAAVWGKVLTQVLPVVGLVALFSFSAVKMGGIRSDLGALAAPCTHDGVAPERRTAGTRQSRLQTIQEHYPLIERAAAGRVVDLDAIDALAEPEPATGSSELE